MLLLLLRTVFLHLPILRLTDDALWLIAKLSRNISVLLLHFFVGNRGEFLIAGLMRRDLCCTRAM